jgi:hypothetical protein
MLFVNLRKVGIFVVAAQMASLCAPWTFDIRFMAALTLHERRIEQRSINASTFYAGKCAKSGG